MSPQLAAERQVSYERALFRLTKSRLILLLGLLVGCDRCTCGGDETGGYGGALPVGDPSEDKLTDHWKQASVGLAIKEASGGETINYRLPPKGCELRYELRWQQLHAIPKTTRPPAGPVTFVGFVAQARDASHLTFTAEWERTDSIADGKTTAGQPKRLPSFAPAQVATDGLSWKEPEPPPTLTWSALAGFPGLAFSFPQLPKTQKLDDVGRWNRVTYSPRQINDYVTRTGDGEAVPRPRPTILGIDTKVEGFLEIDGVRAIVLRANWSAAETNRDHIRNRRTEKWTARYIVLSTGRLLHAAASATRSVWWETKEREQQTQHGEMELELRLTGACDGPTVSSFEVPADAATLPSAHPVMPSATPSATPSAAPSTTASTAPSAAP